MITPHLRKVLSLPTLSYPSLPAVQGPELCFSFPTHPHHIARRGGRGVGISNDCIVPTALLSRPQDSERYHPRGTFSEASLACLLEPVPQKSPRRPTPLSHTHTQPSQSSLFNTPFRLPWAAAQQAWPLLWSRRFSSLSLFFPLCGESSLSGGRETACQQISPAFLRLMTCSSGRCFWRHACFFFCSAVSLLLWIGALLSFSLSLSPIPSVFFIFTRQLRIVL